MKSTGELISLKEFFSKILSFLKFIVSKWKFLFVVGIIGMLFGFLSAYIKPIKYTSHITFIVEENKASGGGIASIAGQFGLDLSSAGGNNGLFSGDNVILFLRSQNLCREVFLTNYDQDGKVTLLDRYAEVTGLKKKWAKNKKIGKIDFSKFKGKDLPRIEDSLMQVVIKTRLLVSDLSVLKPDKKASFIMLSVSMMDEKLSMLFSERLLQVATDRFVKSKLKYKILNIQILEKRADSLFVLLNDKTIRTAERQQSLIDANPALRSTPINLEISSREKNLVAGIYAEVIKNLEISKTLLSQETPVVQVVEKSTYPLEIDKPNYFFSITSFLIAFIIISIVYLSLREILR